MQLSWVESTHDVYFDVCENTWKCGELSPFIAQKSLSGSMLRWGGGGTPFSSTGSERHAPVTLHPPDETALGNFCLARRRYLPIQLGIRIKNSERDGESLKSPRNGEVTSRDE